MIGAVPGQNWLYAKAKADGAVIYGVTVVMDSDGNVSVTCGGMTRTSGSNQNSGLLNTDRKKERLEKRRKEKGEMDRKQSFTFSTFKLSHLKILSEYGSNFLGVTKVVCGWSSSEGL